MFKPITIVDASGDTTTVDLDPFARGEVQIRVKVEDQALMGYLDEHVDTEHANALGVYDVAQAKQLVEALQAAIAEAEGLNA